MRLSIALVIAAAFLAACPTPPVGESVNGKVSGLVVKGPVANATVHAYAATGGHRGQSLGSVTTTDDGRFADLPTGAHQGGLLVCAAGGAYLDEATGLTSTLDPTELCALIPDFRLGAKAETLLTPWTTIHAALAACYVDAELEPDLTAAAERATGRLVDFLGAGDETFSLASVPFDVTSAVAPGLTAEVWAGLLSAALSQQALLIAETSGLEPNGAVTAITLLDALLEDVATDCRFDGLGKDGRQLRQGDVALSPDTLRGAPGGFASALLRFVDEGRNASGLTAGDVRARARHLGGFESDIFGPLFAPPDFDPPTIAFDSPADGATIGAVAPVSVRVEDASPLTECAFDAPDTLVSAAPSFSDGGTSCALEANLNTGGLTGSVEIRARARDEYGNLTRASITVTVNNSIPSITVNAPSSGATVSGTITVRATAQDDDGILSLVVEGAGELQDVQPLPDRFEAEWDTTASPDGPLTLVVRATDNGGNVATTNVPVTVANLNTSLVRGVVDVGGVISDAEVAVYRLNEDGTRGAELAAGVTDDDGHYELSLSSHPSGPILVAARSGSFVDVATGKTTLLNTSDELTAAVDEPTVGGVTIANVNAWTTLAAKRAIERIADNPTLALAISFNRARFEQHLRRPGTTLPIVGTASADLTDNTPDTEADDRTQLALAHAGLSRMAAELSVRTGASVGSITLLDLLAVLLEDLEGDGVLDGRRAGTVLDLDPGGQESATSYVLRRDLAAGIYNFAANLELAGVTQPRNTSGVTPESLAQAGKIVDDVALNADTYLFPFGDVPEPFDRAPPVISFQFGAPHAAADFGAALVGPVTVIATATDHGSRLASFDLLEPAGLEDTITALEDMQLSVGTDILPNVEAAALACGTTIGDPPLDLPATELMVCLCTEAADEIDNAGTALWCFTRPPPALRFDQPTPAEGASVTGPTTVVTSVTPGFDLASFSLTGALATLTPDASVPNQLTVVLPTSFVDTANAPDIVLGVTAEDLAGQSSALSRTITRPSPTATITTPPTGTIFHAGQSVVMSAAATSGYDLASCSASLSSPAKTPPALPAATVTGPSCSFAATLPVTSFEDGTWTLRLDATDLVGRAALPAATRTFIVDTTPPTTSTPSIAGDRVVDVDGQLHVGASSGTTSTYIVSATVSDSAGVEQVEVVVSPSGASPWRVPATRIGGNNYRATITDNAPDGLRSITVEATDNNTNAGASAATTVLKDTVAPTISWTPPANQAPWKNMAPTAPITFCDSRPNQYDFRNDCAPSPATDIISPQNFLASSSAGIVSDLYVWQQHPGPVLSGSAVDTGTGAAHRVVYEAKAGSCAAASELDRVRSPRADGSFDIPLNAWAAVQEYDDDDNPILAWRLTLPLDVDLDAHSNPNTPICLTAAARDAVGNLSAPVSLWFRWIATPPPLNVLFNVPTDGQYGADVTAAVGADFSTMAENADSFLAGGGGQHAVAHAHISNPYLFPVRVRLQVPAGSFPGGVAAELRTRTQQSSDLATTWLTGSSFQAPTAGSGTLVTDNRVPDYDGAAATTQTSTWRFDTVSADEKMADVTRIAPPTNNEVWLMAGAGATAPTISYYDVDELGRATGLPLATSGGFVELLPAAPDHYYMHRASVIVAVFRVSVTNQNLVLYPRGGPYTGTLVNESFGGQAPLLPTQKYIFKTSVLSDSAAPRTYLRVNPGSGSTTHICGGGTSNAECHWIKTWAELTQLRFTLGTINGAPGTVPVASVSTRSTLSGYTATFPDLAITTSNGHATRASTAP